MAQRDCTLIPCPLLLLPQSLSPFDPPTMSSTASTPAAVPIPATLTVESTPIDSPAVIVEDEVCPSPRGSPVNAKAPEAAAGSAAMEPAASPAKAAADGE